jgi:hypothetical protein
VPYDPEPLPDTPVQAPGPIAWEMPERSFFGRLLGTVRSTFSPLTTIRAVSVGEIGPALRFSLVWMLPWMPLWAILPFTHSLMFKYNFAVEVITKPGDLPIAWDVARAMAIGLGLSAIGLATWAIPFASLLRAYGKSPEPGVDPRTAAYRMVLYRAWVVPCGLTLLALSGWSMSAEPNPGLIELSLLGLRLLPRILLLMHCFAMARYFGVEGLASIAVAMVPLVVEMAVGQFINLGAAALAPVTPPPPP